MGNSFSVPRIPVISFGTDLSKLPESIIAKIKAVGAFYIKISEDLEKQLAAEIATRFAGDLPTFDPATYTGYKNRDEEVENGMQQEIISTTENDPSGHGAAYKLLFDIARQILEAFFPEYATDATRLSGVYWRYDPANGKTPEGCKPHVDFSLFGVLFQGAPGLYWLPNGSTEEKVDVYKPGHLLVTFGDSTGKYGLVDRYGFNQFRHGVDRITTATRLAGAIFCDPANDVAEQMAAYHNREATSETTPLDN